MVNNLLLVRVDDRLIHGQVMTAWLKVHPAKTILVVDDPTAKDDFLTEILKAAAPSDVKVLVRTIADGAELLKAGFPDKTFLLVKGPLTLKALKDQGVHFDAVNVGGMGKNAQRRVLYKNVSASPEEIAAFKELIADGTPVSLQIVPAERAFDLQSFIKDA